jgi:hypothetical protein
MRVLQKAAGDFHASLLVAHYTTSVLLTITYRFGVHPRLMYPLALTSFYASPRGVLPWDEGREHPGGIRFGK